MSCPSEAIFDNAPGLTESGVMKFVELRPCPVSQSVKKRLLSPKPVLLLVLALLFGM